MADLCGPLFNAARRSRYDHSPVISTTGAPRCLYFRNKRRAGCFTSYREAKSPRPHCRRKNSVQPSLLAASASQTTYSPMSSGSRACCGRGIRAGRLASGSEVVIRRGIRFLMVVDCVSVEGVVSARVLTDRAGFVVGTWSIRSAPLPIY